MSKCKHCGEEHRELDAVRRGALVDDVEGTLLIASQQASACERIAKKHRSHVGGQADFGK